MNFGQSVVHGCGFCKELYLNMLIALVNSCEIVAAVTSAQAEVLRRKSVGARIAALLVLAS